MDQSSLVDTYLIKFSISPDTIFLSLYIRVNLGSLLRSLNTHFDDGAGNFRLKIANCSSKYQLQNTLKQLIIS